MPTLFAPGKYEGRHLCTCNLPRYIYNFTIEQYSPFNSIQNVTFPSAWLCYEIFSTTEQDKSQN